MNARIRLILPGVVALLLIQGPTAAQESQEPIVTDRPDITESSQVVGPGRFQIEAGILREYQSGRSGDQRSLFTPTLLRWGLTSRWEARFETDGYSRTRTFTTGAGVSRTSGYSTLAPGAKYHIRDAGEGWDEPSLGAIFHLNVPSGSSIYRSEKLTGDAKIAADWDLAPKWSLGVNAGVLFEEDDRGEVFTSGLLTGSLGRELTDRLSSFLELVVQAPESSHGGTAFILDGGFTYLLNLDTQLDVAVGTGLSGATPADVFWTLGISKRF